VACHGDTPWDHRPCVASILKNEGTLRQAFEKQPDSDHCHPVPFRLEVEAWGCTVAEDVSR
jgi:hypothetical protein